MNSRVDGLLNLAKADYQKEQIKMQEIRLDELLLDVREVILRAHPDYHIDLLFEQEEADDDRMITVRGNLYLLNIAFSNLIENNCKYSADKSSFVQISYWDKWTIVRCRMPELECLKPISSISLLCSTVENRTRK